MESAYRLFLFNLYQGSEILYSLKKIETYCIIVRSVHLLFRTTDWNILMGVPVEIQYLVCLYINCFSKK